MATFNTPRPPGFYGKIPAHAEFIGAGLTRTTTQSWDDWIQEALVESQARIGRVWRDVFFAAPIWRFVLTGGACGQNGLMGIVMPSVDAVGRCFPLMLGREVDPDIDLLATMVGGARWFSAAEALALSALDEDSHLFESTRDLPGWWSPDDRRAWATPSLGPHCEGMGIWMALPVASAPAAAGAVEGLVRQWGEMGAPAHRSATNAGRWGRAPAILGAWWTTGVKTPGCDGLAGLGPGLAITRGLVPPKSYAALLDGHWRRHGWLVSDTSSLASGSSRDSEAPDDGADWERST